MRLLGLTTDQEKNGFVQSSAGPKLTQFWEKEVSIRSVAIVNPAQAVHTYEDLIRDSKATLLKYVSRDRALIDLLHIPQGDKTVTEFLAQVEDQAGLCRVTEVPITEEDLKRLALIAGFKDRSLAEKCLGEEYDLKQVIATAITRESSKANAEAVKVQEGGSVKQVLGEEEGMKESLEKLQGDVQTVIKLQQKGKYSGAAKKTCPNCTFEHEKEGKCPAVGRECRRCGQEAHFSRSSLCKGRATKSSTTRRVEDDELPADWEEANYSSEEEDTVGRVEEVASAHHRHGKRDPGDHSQGPSPPGDRGTGRGCSTGGTGSGGRSGRSRTSQRNLVSYNSIYICVICKDRGSIVQM